MSGTAAVTLFAIPKAFKGHIGVIQRNAIEAWTRIQPKPHVLLFGDDEGVAETARDLGVTHVPNVQRNRWGTPLVSDLFAQAQELGHTRLLSYVNADIILFDDFLQALEQVAGWQNRFLMVGRRTDLDLKEPIAFSASDWAQRLQETARTQGKLQIARNIDYFAFTRGLYPAMPPLAVGRFWWDNWLVWKARSLNAPVVEATEQVLAVHQNHDYSHTTYGPGKHTMMASEESILNCRLTCEQNPADFEEGLSWRYVYTIDDANYKLTRDGIRPRPKHFWKSFKRNSSRPAGMARLLRRAILGSKQKTSSLPSH
jgi:hypothetical protein